LRISENMAHRVVPAPRFGGAAGFGFSPATMALRANMAGGFQSASTPENPTACGRSPRRGGKSCPVRPRAAQPGRSRVLLRGGGPPSIAARRALRQGGRCGRRPKSNHRFFCLPSTYEAWEKTCSYSRKRQARFQTSSGVDSPNTTSAPLSRGNPRVLATPPSNSETYHSSWMSRLRRFRSQKNSSMLSQSSWRAPSSMPDARTRGRISCFRSAASFGRNLWASFSVQPVRSTRSVSHAASACAKCHQRGLLARMAFLRSRSPPCPILLRLTLNRAGVYGVLHFEPVG
jgi:hypothetical protein